MKNAYGREKTSLVNQKTVRFLRGGMFLLILTGTISARADVSENNDTLYVPERAVILHGNTENIDRDVMAVFYTREDMSPNDPDAPRFLFLDRKGKIAFGIGGQVKATASYDMRGAIENTGFDTYDIFVPSNPAERSRLGADVSHSSLFLKLVGNTQKFGMFQVYLQTNFTGDNGGYGFKLKQAYATLGHLTVGLTNSSFVDAATQAPTIDCEGPSGQVSSKNVLFRYTTPVRNGFSGAISVELPQTTYTLTDQTEKLSARVPDIPAYVQYSWAQGQHLRLAAIFRDMAYRDLKTSQNCLEPGYGVKLSAITNIDTYGIAQFFGHIAYGKGIGKYVNDLSGNGFDLVYSKTAGRMIAPEMMAWTAGLIFNPTSRLQFTGAFSRAQVYNLDYMSGDTYQYGQYVDVNGFYSIDANFKIGAEYLHGWRHDYNGETGNANRLEVLVQYSF